MKPLSERMQYAANNPMDGYDWIEWLAELRCLEARIETLEKPAKAENLEEVIDRVEMAMANLEAIPDDLYSPWDEGITMAFNTLDDLSPQALRDELAALAAEKKP